MSDLSELLRQLAADKERKYEMGTANLLREAADALEAQVDYKAHADALAEALEGDEIEGPYWKIQGIEALCRWVRSARLDPNADHDDLESVGELVSQVEADCKALRVALAAYREVER